MPSQQVETGRDGLPVLLQGPWSRDKLHFVEYFSALFSGEIKNKWTARAYVDLFSGPGICKDRKLAKSSLAPRCDRWPANAIHPLVLQ